MLRSLLGKNLCQQSRACCRSNASFNTFLHLWLDAQFHLSSYSHGAVGPRRRHAPVLLRARAYQQRRAETHNCYSTKQLVNLTFAVRLVENVSEKGGSGCSLRLADDLRLADFGHSFLPILLPLSPPKLLPKSLRANNSSAEAESTGHLASCTLRQT